jgi:hypothetical protein
MQESAQRPLLRLTNKDFFDHESAFNAGKKRNDRPDAAPAWESGGMNEVCYGACDGGDRAQVINV